MLKENIMEKNVHILATDQPSRLVKNLKGVFSLMNESLEVGGAICNINMYVTSDGKIKEGDYIYSFADNRTYKIVYSENNIIQSSFHSHYSNESKKIILTTDTILIADGVQAIDDEFLEWFVKNPSCEFVEIGKHLKFVDIRAMEIYKDFYEIIIPQEGPKQELEKELFELEQELGIPTSMRWHNSKPKQETLEEVRKVERSDLYNKIYSIVKQIPREDVETDAMDASSCAYDIEQLFYKWRQERMYSEEEIEHLIHLAVFQSHCGIKDRVKIPNSNECAGFVNKWFEQNKKK